MSKAVITHAGCRRLRNGLWQCRITDTDNNRVLVEVEAHVDEPEAVSIALRTYYGLFDEATENRLPHVKRIRYEEPPYFHDTTISGYSVQFPEPPDDSLCPFCATGPCVAMCEPPADDRAYLAAWRSGDFDDELVEHTEGLFAVGYERLLGGVE